MQSNLYKATTLGTTQIWLSYACGRLIKQLYETITDQMWLFLAWFRFFSNSSICFNKDLRLRSFWFYSWILKSLLFILNAHILRNQDGCLLLTRAPKLKMLLFFIKVSVDIRDHLIMTFTNNYDFNYFCKNVPSKIFGWVLNRLWAICLRCI